MFHKSLKKTAKTEALENAIKKGGSIILAAVARVYVSSRLENGLVLDYSLPQLGQSALVTKPLAAGNLFNAVAQPNVGRHHAVNQ